jgi:hypothetical protein
MEERRDLHDTLEKLHSELHDARRVDPEERDLLVELMTDIRRVLDAPAGPAADAGPEAERHRGLRERLDRSLYDLQESHPQLVDSVRHVVDYLSAMGI